MLEFRPDERCRRINCEDVEADILIDLARIRAAARVVDEAQRLAEEARVIAERSEYVLQGGRTLIWNLLGLRWLVATTTQPSITPRNPTDSPLAMARPITPTPPPTSNPPHCSTKSASRCGRANDRRWQDGLREVAESLRDSKILVTE